MSIHFTENKFKILEFLSNPRNILELNEKYRQILYSDDAHVIASHQGNNLFSLCILEERKWDSSFFKRKMGIIYILQFRLGNNTDLVLLVNKTLNMAKKLSFKHILIRINDLDFSLIRVAELNGFELMDAGIILKTNIDKLKISDIRKNNNVREMVPSDISFIQSYITDLFHHSYFYRDPFFSGEESDNLFRTWLYNCFNEYSEKVFVYDSDHQAVGFVTCSVDENRNGQLPLVGVHNQYSGKGIASSIINSSLHWYLENNIKNIYVKTQGQNKIAINLYIKNGFYFDHLDCTYTKSL
jgi:ribosomal protein S18 acetylase RimI-like enzyme